MKRTLLYAALAAPLLWLLFSQQGQRMTDLFMLRLFGGSAIEVQIAQLGPQATEKALIDALPNVDFNCRDNPTPYGDRTCHAKVVSFNTVPASYLTLFFAKGGLNALKLAYQPRYHAELIQVLNERVGPAQATGNGPEGAPPLLRWPTPWGMAILPEQRPPDAGAEMLWLARQPR